MNGTTMASTSSSNLPSVSCVARSTVEALKCPPLQSTRTQDVFQSVVKGRKSWKTLRGGEVVWPPELEAALIEGLENYKPDDSRETRLLGRFPMRNRFISDYIFEKTGKRRTAKQVGSRLQQLRDTCGGKKLLSLLSPIRRIPRPAHSLTSNFASSSLRDDGDSSSDGSTPSTPTDAHATLQNLLYRGVGGSEYPRQPIVYIDLLPEDVVDDGSQGLPQVDEEICLSRGYYPVRSADRPRRLREIDPTITLSSASVHSSTSHFLVSTSEGEVHSESVPMEYVGNPPSDGSLHLYKTTLVPGFWATLRQSSDPTQFTIMQRVVDSDGTVTFSATYKFSYPSSFLNQDFQPFPGSYQTQDNVKIVQPQSQLDFGAFDSLFVMSGNENIPIDMEYQKPFYGTNANEQWNMSSPVSLSSGCGSDFDQLSACEEEMRSPMAASFPTNVQNYIPVLH